MRVAGARTFAAPRAAVWHVLNDPASMAATMPGVESFDVQDERRWRANVKIPLGLGALGMTMNMEKTEEREPEFARLAIKGNGVGAILSMTTAFNAQRGRRRDEHGVGGGRPHRRPGRLDGPARAPADRQPAGAARAGRARRPGAEGRVAAEGSPDPEPDTGTSGAEEGVSPLAPETYEPEPEGPTTSTED